ncbi:MAG: hypothetical protein ABSC95_17255 [Acetobacteraceae bacterium]|jgi:hypothetical protein
MSDKSLYGKVPNFTAQLGYTAARLVVVALRSAGKQPATDSFGSGMEGIRDATQHETWIFRTLSASGKLLASAQ